MVVTDTSWTCNPTYTTKYPSGSPATQTYCSSMNLVLSNPNSFTQVVGWLELFQLLRKGTHLWSKTKLLFNSTSTPLQERKWRKIPYPLKFNLKECTRGLGTEWDGDNISREMLCKQLPLRYIPPLPSLRDRVQRHNGAKLVSCWVEPFHRRAFKTGV